MGCNFPLKGWQSAQRTESGKRGFTTDRASALVDLPMEVPCGQCIGCRVDKAQEWATRLEAERTFHRDARFLTVTYSDEHLPEGCTLVPADLKRFIERLRHWADVHLDGQKLRFYGCGEYGDDPMVALDGFPLGRPHYHIIVYGIAFPDEKVAEQSAAGEKQFSSKILDDLWGKGRTRVGLVTRDSCGYVAGYATKKITGDIAVSHYQQFDLRTGVVYPVEPEFARMSRRPGIGRRFVEEYQSDVYPTDHVVQRGKPRKVPRYFDKVLEQSRPEVLEGVKRKRVARAKAKAHDNTFERREVKAEVAWRKSRVFRRNGAG